MEEKERYKWSQDAIVECPYEDYDYIVDTENNIIFDDDNYFKLVDLLNQQDKRIKELEKQLAENNEFFNAFACKDFNEFKDFISTFMLAPHEEQTLIRELKQQLAITEKALELACEEIGRIEAKFGSAYIRANGYLLDYFKTKAKEMLKSE